MVAHSHGEFLNESRSPSPTLPFAHERSPSSPKISLPPKSFSQKTSYPNSSSLKPSVRFLELWLELTREGNCRNREPPQSTLFSLVYNSPNNEDDLPFAIIHKPKATSKPKYFVTPTPPVRIYQTRKHTAELKIAAESSKVVRSSETKEENMIEEFEVPTEIEDDSEQEEFVPTHPKVRRSNQNLKKFLAIVAPKNKRKQDVSLRNIGIKHAIDMNERINLSAFMIKHMNRIISLGIDPHDLAYEFLLTIVLENFRVKLKNGKIATESDIINVKTLIEYDCLTTNLITQLMFDLEVAQAKNARLKDETTRLQNRVATSQAEVVQLREVVQLKNDMLMQQNAHLAAFDAMMVQLKDDMLTHDDGGGGKRKIGDNYVEEGNNGESRRGDIDSDNDSEGRGGGGGIKKDVEEEWW
ncbi:hypothetical protein FXO37_32099 [Capsicum annuum]|nr:hypothetical protein FXO37_32099 [Capsicum annuum]